MHSTYLACVRVPRSCAAVAHIPGYQDLLSRSLSRRFSPTQGWGKRENRRERAIAFTSSYVAELARISHRFLLNGYHWLDNKELWGSAKYGLSLRWCSAETSKRQAREAVLSLRPAWSRARARSRRGSRSALPRIASRICETSGLASATPAQDRGSQCTGNQRLAAKIDILTINNLRIKLRNFG